MKALSLPAIPKSTSLRLHHRDCIPSSSSFLCLPLLPSNPLSMAAATPLSLFYRKPDSSRTWAIPAARAHSTSAPSVSNTPKRTSPSASPTRRKLQDGTFPPSRSSLYARPSLREMQNERAANRSRVCEFLRGLGIVPDELDGLELPVTVDVMRERIYFLHSLGLTIVDINIYPLVLGCSIKKNTVPVLDHLGKLSVRKSTLTQLLRHYPQVLSLPAIPKSTPSASTTATSSPPPPPFSASHYSPPNPCPWPLQPLSAFFTGNLTAVEPGPSPLPEPPLSAKNYLIPVDSDDTFCLALVPTSSLLSIIGNT